MSVSTGLTVLTLNLLNDLKYWNVRAPLVLETIGKQSPDLVAFQEVALPQNNAAWLAEQLSGYTVYLCPLSRQRGRHEGLAILSRLPVENHDTIALGAQNRVAQRVTFHHGGHRWMFVNTHLFWSPLDDPIRTRQVEQILHWSPEHMHSVICGDFNALPHYRAIKRMKRSLVSAYESAHGIEPVFTFPTALKRGPGLRNSARRTALRMVGQVVENPCEAWCGALDYIFISDTVQVKCCEITFDLESPDDRGVYPSDHLGLVAQLDISPGHESITVRASGK